MICTIGVTKRLFLFFLYFFFFLYFSFFLRKDLRDLPPYVDDDKNMLVRFDLDSPSSCSLLLLSLNRVVEDL